MSLLAGTVAITGANGFIGSHTAAALAQAGVPVRMLCGPPGNAGSAVAAAGWSITADIADAGALDQLCSGAEALVHAAGPPSVAESRLNPVEHMRVHGVGTTAVLAACVRRGVRRIVHISSAEVYGNRTPCCVPETQPLAASSPYAAAKIGAEQMVRAFAAAGKMEAFILRPFSVYGPGMSSGGVVSHVLSQGLNRTVIQVRDPKPVRDFCFVSDIARAVVAACHAPVEGVAVANLGSGVGTSIGDLATLAAELTRAPGIQHPGEERLDGCEVTHLVADTRQSQRLLGWTALTSLRDGLGRTIEWMARQ